MAYNHKNNVDMLQSVSIDNVSGLDTLIANAGNVPIIVEQPLAVEPTKVELQPSIKVEIVPVEQKSNNILNEINKMNEKRKNYAIIGLSSIVVLLVLILIFK